MQGLREKSSLKTPEYASVPPPTVPVFSFGEHQLSIQTDNSNGSPCNLNATTPVSTVSQTLSPMSNIGALQEGGPSVTLLNLTVNEVPVHEQVEDSFDSSPDSSFDKGALEFISLVEKALERSSSVGFDQLVLEMLDLGLGERVPTSAQIPCLLNEKGWNVQQVLLQLPVMAKNGM